MQGYKSKGYTGFGSRISVELGSVTGEKSSMNCYDCGFSEPSLMLLLPGREAIAGICDCPLTISRGGIYSAYVDGDGVAAIGFIW